MRRPALPLSVAEAWLPASEIVLCELFEIVSDAVESVAVSVPVVDDFLLHPTEKKKDKTTTI